MLGLHINEIESFELSSLFTLLSKRRVGASSIPIYIKSMRSLGLTLFLVSAHPRALVDELGHLALRVGLFGRENLRLRLVLPPELLAQLLVDLRVLSDLRRAQLRSVCAFLAPRFGCGINLLKLDAALALYAQLDCEGVQLFGLPT